MGRFDGQIETAQRLLQKNGTKVTLRKITPGAPSDPSKPWEPGADVSSIQTGVWAVFLDYEQMMIDGSLIQMGDRKALIPAQNLTEAPQVNGHVINGSDVWTIKSVKPLNPNGQNIMFEVQLRK